MCDVIGFQRKVFLYLEQKDVYLIGENTYNFPLYKHMAI